MPDTLVALHSKQRRVSKLDPTYQTSTRTISQPIP
jgi:hypothetical protein